MGSIPYKFDLILSYSFTINRREKSHAKSSQRRLLFTLIIFILPPYAWSLPLNYGYTTRNEEKHELANNEEQFSQSSADLQQYFNELINLPNILYRDAARCRTSK